MWPMLMLSLALNVFAPASHHAAGVQAETQILTLINNVRDSHRLPPLAANAALGAAATRHARQMLAGGSIFHTAILHSVAPAWPVLGENVGMAATADDVFAYFMRSAEHRDNILDRTYSAAGVGVVEDAAGGTFFVTVLFGG